MLALGSSRRSSTSPCTGARQSQIVDAGATVTLSVTAAGSGALGYQWKFNASDIVGATNPALILPNVQPANAGNYIVAIDNLAGSITSATAILTVNTAAEVPPRIDRVEWNGDTINILFTVNPTYELALEYIDSLFLIPWTTLTNVSARTAPLS